MRLAEIPRTIVDGVVRDAAFDALGFVSHASPARLVFVDAPEWALRLHEAAGIAAVIAPPALLGALPEEIGVALAASPRRAFFALHHHLATATGFYGPGPGYRIAPSARIHPTACVADRDVVIGERVVLEPHVTILPRVELGDDVVVRAGAVIGGEGFQFPVIDGALVSVPHAGGVRIGPRVEVQAGCCVDRAVFGGATEIGADTKLDNLVHVGHNARLGRRCRLAAMAMLSGSVVLGDDVWIGPRAALSHDVRVGDGAAVSIGAVVTRDVAPGQRVTGNFAVDHERFLAHLRSIR